MPIDDELTQRKRWSIHGGSPARRRCQRLAKFGDQFADELAQLLRRPGRHDRRPARPPPRHSTDGRRRRRRPVAAGQRTLPEDAQVRPVPQPRRRVGSQRSQAVLSLAWLLLRQVHTHRREATCYGRSGRAAKAASSGQCHCWLIFNFKLSVRTEKKIISYWDTSSCWYWVCCSTDCFMRLMLGMSNQSEDKFHPSLPMKI